MVCFTQVTSSYLVSESKGESLLLIFSTVQTSRLVLQFSVATLFHVYKFSDGCFFVCLCVSGFVWCEDGSSNGGGDVCVCVCMCVCEWFCVV